MRRALILLLITLPSLGGCGGDSKTDHIKDEKSKAATTAPLDTPEAAFSTLAAAAEDSDWQAATHVLTPESQAMLTSGMIMTASFMTMGDDNKEKELTELLGRHGINLDDEPEQDADASQTDMMMAMVKPIEDIPLFVGQLTAWMEKNSEDRSGGFAKLGKLGDVTLEGDAAKAICQTDMGPHPIEFRRVDGSWLVHLPMDAPPPGGSDSDFEEPDDGTPGLGTLWYGDKEIKLRHALAYKSKHFDDPCTVVLLTAKPVFERDMNTLKEMLQDRDGDDTFFASGPHVKLSLDAAGQLMFMFAWVDNMSINRNDGVDLDVKLDGNRVRGTAKMAKPDTVAETEYRFQAEFDVELTQPD